MKKLYAERRDDFKEFIINKDGSLYARIPKSWVKRISPPRQMSEEQRQAASDRFKKMWQDKQA